MIKLFQLIMLQAARQPVVKFEPPPLVITQQPTDFTGQTGEAFQLLILSNGTGYAFYKGNTLISQNKTGALVFGNLAVSDSGNYYSVVTDDYGQFLNSVTVTLTVTEKEITPTPNPDPNTNPQPINGTITQLNKIGNNKTYNNTALAGKSYLLFRNGYQRFLLPSEYDVLSTGGFELHSPLITGDCIMVMPLDENIIGLNKLIGNSTYTNTSLAGKSYAVYRNGYRRLLAAHELDIHNDGGFALHSPIITGDSVVVFVGAAILNNLSGNSEYVDANLQDLNYTLYREGLGRFLNNNEFDKLTGGGFKLHSPLIFNERLFVFKL
jgi:hypothetical protein